jgi:dolichol-phosphate mannosyltransferase
MLSAITETAQRGIPIDIYLFDPKVSDSYSRTLDEGAMYFKELGLQVYTEMPQNKKYDIVYSTYPYCYDEVIEVNQVDYFVKFCYALSAANVPHVNYLQSIYNFYDYILCLGEPDVAMMSGHAKAINIGNIKLANYKRTRVTPDGKKTLLWLPSWGSSDTSSRAVSISKDGVQKLLEMQNEYNIIVKMHPLTSHREDQKEHYELISQFDNVLAPDTRTDELFNLADVVLSDLTSGAFDSIAADVPLALFGLGEPVMYGGKLCFHQQLVKDGIVPGTEDLDQLGVVIEKALTPDIFEKQQKLKREMFPYEGHECVEAFMRFQDDLLEGRVDPWYIATRRALRENYFNEQNEAYFRNQEIVNRANEAEEELETERASYEAKLEAMRVDYQAIQADLEIFASNGVKKECDLSIIVPCLNEAENVEQCLTNILQVIDTIPNCTSEIVVVDDQSEDETFIVTQDFINKGNLEDRIILVKRNLKRRGYGAVVRYGVAHAHGRYAIFVSADMVDPIEHLPVFYQMMEEGADLVQCNRYQNPGDTTSIPFIYLFWQFFYRRFVSLILGTKLTDTTYAFKMFKRTDLLAVGLAQNRFSISPEITFKVLLSGGSVQSFAAPQGTRVNGISKFKFVKEAYGYGYVLLRSLLHRMGVILWF